MKRRNRGKDIKLCGFRGEVERAVQERRWQSQEEKMKRRASHPKCGLCAADSLLQDGQHCGRSCGRSIGVFMRNMRYIRYILMVSVTALFLSACGKGNTQTAVRQANTQTGVADILAAGSAAAEASKAAEVNREAESTAREAGGMPTEADTKQAQGTAQSGGGITAVGEAAVGTAAGKDSAAFSEAGDMQDSNTDSFAAGSVNPAHLAAPEDMTPEKIEKALSGTAGVDVDLTQLSSVMVFSEVYNIMVLPQDYMGKTIRMEGITAIYTDEATGQKYYSCIVQDATACCAQGIEFRLKDADGNPSAYPKEGEMITVTGVFDIYAENGYQYALLTDAVLE